MNINVTKTQVSITNDYILNDKEYNVNKCYFTFSEEYTNQLVKKAIFVQGTATIEEPIINNECLIPSEVLNRGTFELRVYAYEVEDEELILRYSPTPTLVYVRAGSYIEGAESPEVITPSQFEQYMQALNDGLNEVANVNIDAEQLTNGSKITITDRTGTEKIVYVYDGVDGVDGKDATINGVNTLSIVAGENIGLNQVGDTLTINNIYDDTQIVNDITNLQSGLSGEILNRQNADNNLQSQIDAITVSSDVIDVVGTYQELLDYDTSHVKANDIIKVLQDSTHNGALSYYRWVIVNHIGSWEYVGSEGPFYTKSETDELLNAKQNEITSSNKLSADLVDDSTSTNKFITQSQANQIVTNQNNITNLQTNKQDKLTFDETPIENSTNPVTSGGIYTSQEKQNELIDYLSLYANALPKVTGTGTEVTLNDTAECPMPMSLKPSATSQATSILPDGYTQVDYIQSSGTQYIDTGYVFTTEYGELDIDEQVTEVPTGDTPVAIGGLILSGTGRTFLLQQNSTSGIYYQNGISPLNISSNINNNLKHNIKCVVSDKHYLYIDNTLIGNSVKQGTIINSNGLIIFARKSGTSAPTNYVKMRLFKYKLYDNNVLVRNMIPCYRNSDSEVGLYDLVNDVFYTNAGTGDFTYGSVATLPNPDYPVDIHTVSGSNTIEVTTGNLSDDIFQSGNSYGASGTRLRLKNTIPITKGKIYKLSYNGVRTDLQMVINTNSIATYGWSVYDYCGNDTTWVTAHNNIIRFTSTNDGYLSIILAYVGNGTINPTDNIDFDKFLLVEEQTLPFNLGTIELCKIGNYEDYFYKESGKWYLKKNVLKTSDAIGSLSKTISDMVSNATVYSYCGGTVSGTTITYSSALTVENEIYYPTTTPTNTEIPDTTLIEQLEAIYNKAISYQDQTNITQVNNDLPFVITASAIYDLSNLLN